MLLQFVLLWLFRFIKLPNFSCCNREDWVQFGTLVEHDEQSSKPWLGCLNLTRQALQRNFSWVRDNRWFCSRYCAFVKSSWRCRFCSCSFCFCMIWSRLAIVVLYSLHLRHLLIGKGSDKHLAILSMMLFLHVVSSATFLLFAVVIEPSGLDSTLWSTIDQLILENEFRCIFESLGWSDVFF